MGRNNSDFHSAFAVPHPEKPGKILRNTTGQHDPEFWVPMALDMERREANQKENDN